MAEIITDNSAIRLSIGKLPAELIARPANDVADSVLGRNLTTPVRAEPAFLARARLRQVTGREPVRTPGCFRTPTSNTRRRLSGGRHPKPFTTAEAPVAAYSINSSMPRLR